MPIKKSKNKCPGSRRTRIMERLEHRPSLREARRLMLMNRVHSDMKRTHQNLCIYIFIH